ncbi:hypothetical protein RKD55_002060 [Rossellomorea marisflavi]
MNNDTTIKNRDSLDHDFFVVQNCELDRQD